jgi:hypothetical protein
MAEFKYEVTINDRPDLLVSLKLTLRLVINDQNLLR